MDHKIVILGIVFYHNTFSHICGQHQHYPEYDTFCLSIFYYWIVFCISLINDSMFTMFPRHMFLEFFRHTDIIVFVQECIRIYESNIFDPGSLTLDIN